MVGQVLRSRQFFQMVARGEGSACSKVDLRHVEPGYLATGNTDWVTAHRRNGCRPFPLRSLTQRGSVGADLTVGPYTRVPHQPQFIEQAPGPRGSPQAPHAVGASLARLPPFTCAANTDRRRSRVVPWHEGHRGGSFPRTRTSNR